MFFQTIGRGNKEVRENWINSIGGRREKKEKQN